MNNRPDQNHAPLQGYARGDGRKGIRNYVLVVYTVYCAEHVARQIVGPFRLSGCQMVGFDPCYPSEYGLNLMIRLATHPNVGSVLTVSLGCEEFDRTALKTAVIASGRPWGSVVIQEAGGTLKSIAAGREWVGSALRRMSNAQPVPLTPADLVIGLECGGSDAFSGITANPALGRFADRWIDGGGTVIFEETCELFGCEQHLADRARTPELAREVVQAIQKAVTYYRRLGHASFGGGNISSGLSTIEEKSAGAYAKSGHRPLEGILTPGDIPPGPGLYLLDGVYDGDLRHGIPNIHDTHSVTTLAACSCHLVLFTTGCGSVVGQAVAPVIKICSNTPTYERLRDDMDVNAGGIVDGTVDLEAVADRIACAVADAAGGRATRSEALGHQESYISDGYFTPRGSGCGASRSVAPGRVDR